jgi:hypothetical protein
MLREAIRPDNTAVNLDDLPQIDANVEVVDYFAASMAPGRYETVLTAQGLDQPTSMLP